VAIILTVNHRPYQVSDTERVITVFHSSIHSLAAPFYNAEQLTAWAPDEMDVARWQKRFASLHTIIAEHGGVIAGFVSYEDNGHLDLLFTHPDFARQGVATRLYKQAEAAMLVAGASRVFAEASLAARTFFESCGFEIDHEEEIECRGVPLRRFAMQKQICNE